MHQISSQDNYFLESHPSATVITSECKPNTANLELRRFTPTVSNSCILSAPFSQLIQLAVKTHFVRPTLSHKIFVHSHTHYSPYWPLDMVPLDHRLLHQHERCLRQADHGYIYKIEHTRDTSVLHILKLKQQIRNLSLVVIWVFFLLPTMMTVLTPMFSFILWPVLRL